LGSTRRASAIYSFGPGWRCSTSVAATLSCTANFSHAPPIVGVDLSIGMLREARRAGHGRYAQAARHGLYAQADAQALPFADARFDRVMANHMLFHVPDIERALREMRRVLRPGGRLVLTTNGARFMQPWVALHAEVGGDLGYELEDAMVSRFTLDDLPLVQRVFPTAERHTLDSFLVFPNPEPALRFYATGLIDRVKDRPADGSHRPRLLPLMRQRIQTIIATKGAFRVPKTVGWFTADV
jgi:SAM-dependent methyltransferase